MPDLTPSSGGCCACKQALCQALARDCSQRSDYDSLIADVLPCVMQINYTLKRLRVDETGAPSFRPAAGPARVEVLSAPRRGRHHGALEFPVMLSLGPSSAPSPPATAP